MAIARKRLFDPTHGPWIHAISRCVRRAHLCGGRDGRYDHRRAWMEERLELLSRVFACEIAAYAVMSNHFHVVVRMRPQEPAGWSAVEVATRWMSIFPRTYLSDGTPVLPSEATIAAQAADWRWIAEKRGRLADLGWFMRSLKEPIARRANREDACSGAFWEGRFDSIPLLDQPALIACMAYVDLNPIRAKMAATPETSRHTGVRQRIRARQRVVATSRVAARGGDQALAASGLADRAPTPNWIVPVERCIVGEALANKRLSTDDYLTLVDATGRVIRPGKRGAIPASLAPILARLDLRVEGWIATMLGWRQMRGSAVGGSEARIAEAARRGTRWVKNHCPLFSRRTAA